MSDTSRDDPCLEEYLVLVVIFMLKLDNLVTDNLVNNPY